MPAFLLKLLAVAVQMSHPGAIAAAAAVLACLLIYLAVSKGKTKIVLLVAAVVLAAVGCTPLFAYSYFATHGLYSVHVQVLGVDGSPVPNATVQCGPGGKVKSVAGGVECDIPPGSVPADGNFTASASVESAALAGTDEVQLGENYTPEMIVQLAAIPPARVQGTIMADGDPIPGAYVSVAGYDNELIVTSGDGTFDLPAHAKKGETVQMQVKVPQFRMYAGPQKAGDNDIVIVMER